MQPSLTPAPTVDDINTSQRELYDALSGARTGAQLRVQGTWVHVAVVAEAHVRATHAVAVGGERIIVRSGPYFIQDFRKSYISIVSGIREPDGTHGNQWTRQRNMASRMCHVENQVRQRISRS